MTDFRLFMLDRRFNSAALLLIVFAFLHKGIAQGLVDDSNAVIWSTRSSTGMPQLKALYGNPQAYIPDIINGRNNYYSFQAYTWSQADFGFGALDSWYSASTVYYHLNATLQFAEYLIPRSGTYVYALQVIALSNQVTGISVDWVSGLIYWSDALYRRICMLDTSTYGFWRPVVDGNLTSPQDVVIYPHQSLLFWIDLGKNPTIEKLDLRTEERRILLSNPTLQRPTKLTIDFSGQRLFWLDSVKATIGSMNFDGSNVTLWTQSAFSTISSFALFQNFIFLGSNFVSVIHIYNRIQQQYITNITQNGKGIIDMTVWSRERNPPVSSPCTPTYGGCDHFCITISSTLRRCLCAMGFILAPNGTACVAEPLQTNRFLLLSDEWQRNIFQIDVDTGEVRALLNNKNLFPVVTALTFDRSQNNLYWFDKSNLIINRTNLDGKITLPLPNVTNPLGSEITSIAIDAKNQILFYVDYIVQTISMMYLSNFSSTTIYSQAGSRPRTIVLDTNNRWLYWSDCGRMTIERGSMANPNVNRVVIVAGLSSCAVTFTIDFQSQIIFWGDSSGSIETAMLDGTLRRAIFQDSNAAFTGLALDAQFVYIADSNKRQIQKLDRNSRQVTNLTRLLFTQPYALLYYPADTTSSTATYGLTTSMSTGISTSNVFSNSSSSASSDHSSVTTIVVASVISGAVVLIAIIVTIGVVITIKRRRVTPSDESPVAVAADNPRTYEPLRIDRRYVSTNPQTFTNESAYEDIVYPAKREERDSVHEYNNVLEDP